MFSLRAFINDGIIILSNTQFDQINVYI